MWIKDNKMSFPISLMCSILNVDRSSYYYWASSNNDESSNKKDNKLNQLIYEIFINSRKNYGTRRIKAKLLSLYGLIVSRRLISMYMKQLSLSVKTKNKYHQF